ncbi:hypothetical protein ABFS82_03G037700 [Erythranthe guttata]|uniref:pumilio homolog 12-like isoform X2 n=1 Tax=Erythranthe guttata TaxID=4155 RepID=UPI00064DA0FD|nr:PREDICTED: pumilio homolog 12-like isoform X2 [Erythranthe guttata]|eukprot:XP_012851762.1 PREDICTED: pumilio homolog 12-like isoform X2 [Erythranthe guttata]
MERNPYSRPSQPPENLSTASPRRFPSAEIYPQTHLMTGPYAASEETIESAFARLAPYAQTTSFNGLHYALHAAASAAEPLPPPMAYEGEIQRALVWAQAQTANGGGFSGPHSFPGPHRQINVGPDAAAAGFPGPNPHLLLAPTQDSMNFHQRRDFCNAGCDDYRCSSLHGKEPYPQLSRNTGFPSLPLDQQYEWRAKQLTPANMRGKIVSLANDQIWSRALNLKLETGSSNELIESILPEVMASLGDLLRNQFGGDFVQKLFVSCCNEDQRTRIIVALTKSPPQLISICLNSLGARGVQNLLQHLTTPQQISLVVSALGHGCIALATDPNGLYVMQFCVNNFPGEYNKHVFNVVAANFFKVATHRNGCCLLQSCVEKSHGETRKRLIGQILANGVDLSQDPYGNYVVQHLIGLRIQEVTEDLLRRFRGHFWYFSCDKFASNVVEKFLTESGENICAAIIRELLSSPNASALLLHQFGNFVVQSALSASKGQVRDGLIDLIKLNAPSMQSNLYGQKILDWLEKRRIPYNV